jgi:hypothetical protein
MWAISGNDWLTQTFDLSDGMGEAQLPRHISDDPIDGTDPV